jgi:hypothetical protein
LTAHRAGGMNPGAAVSLVPLRPFAGVYLPKGDATKRRILGRTVNGKPVDGTLLVKGPFYRAVDQQDRIWVTNSASNTVTRFPATDPGKAEQITVGYAPRAVAIDSLGNAWVANTVGHPGTMEKLAFIEEKIKSKIEGLEDPVSKADEAVKLWIGLYELLIKYRGDVSMVRPDGTILPPVRRRQEHQWALGHRH